MTPEERRRFVRDHRTGVLGYGRSGHGPAMSVVHYVIDDDDTILVSTTADRGKARAVARSPKISLCVLDERWPPTYLQVYADAAIDDEPAAAADTMLRVGGVLAGAPLDESLRPFLADKAAAEHRVVLRLRPYATFETAPGAPAADGERTAGALPWRDADDPTEDLACSDS